MYQGDSFFTLSQGGQLGLALLSFVLALMMVFLAYSLARGRHWIARLSIALILFVLFVWLSPQAYYQYYRIIIVGLPQQWVVGWPDLNAPRFLVFQGQQNLSAHGQGVLGWLMIVAAMFARRGRVD